VDANPATPTGPFLIEILEGTAPDGTPLHTLITNVFLVPQRFQGELQMIVDCARMQQAGIRKVTEAPTKFQDSTGNVDPAQNLRLPFDELRKEAEARTMLCAFRDAVELVTDPLENIRRILHVWQAKKIHEIQGNVTIDLEKDAKFFDKLPLKEKFVFLHANYGFQVPEELRTMVEQLVRARNCLVHRNGTVAARDCDDSGRLELKWQVTEILLAKSEEEFREGRFERVNLPFVVPEGHVVALRRTTTTRHYIRGEKIRISPQDLNDVCATLLYYALKLKELLQQFGVDNGVETTNISQDHDYTPRDTHSISDTRS